MPLTQQSSSPIKLCSKNERQLEIWCVYLAARCVWRFLMADWIADRCLCYQELGIMSDRGRSEEPTRWRILRSQCLPCHLFNNDSRRPYKRTINQSKSSQIDWTRSSNVYIHINFESAMRNVRSSAHAPGATAQHHTNVNEHRRMRHPSPTSHPSATALWKQQKGAVVPS